MYLSILVTLVSAVVFAALFFRPKRVTPPLHHPPGPKALPLVGNVLDMPMTQMWLTATKWAAQFGQLVYLHVFGLGIIFLNDSETAIDLMEKRGAIYSDRPHLVMLSDLCGAENILPFTHYGDQLRRHRRLMQQALNPVAIKAYQPLLEIESLPFLRRLLSNPSAYMDHIRRYAGTLTLNVIYGHQVTSDDDEFLTIAEECGDLFANHLTAGGGVWLVDVLPFLKHIPTWFPGAGFKRKAAVWKAKFEEFAEKPFASFKSKMKTGDCTPCFCSTLWQREGQAIDPQMEFDLKWAANTIYSGSLDTTITTMSQFILAMVLHPEVQIKAQKEIDSVVGSERLPTLSDRPFLPYTECVMSECWRWASPVAVGVPHRLMEDDIYKGMFLPKGSLVFANIWAMLHDESLFPNPNKFDPDRFLEKADEQTERKRDPRTYVFGFGRRRCPGMHLAESTVWLLMVSMLAALDLRKAKDENGNEVDPVAHYNNSVFTMPDPFKFDVRPREHMEKLVETT
ncbi:hypothetical protein JAAARDRAFT_253315 [Jaapia argillacea MUCL 33604]|uniref:Cytochrome P450 n=1 Tax=Jaapia argillacea MUCL 33604 TaxID=933084 RepID=A0A067Q5W9_9AGAM|nr:hypothetical protein JAAARDRAFT_253315 [Jaapia argillacea MUCL 33604]